MLHLLNDLKQCKNVEDAYPFGEYHHVVMKDAGRQIELNTYLQQTNRQYDLKEVQPDIEDCFIALNEKLSMSNDKVITADQLTKRFGDFTAVDAYFF